MSTPGGPRFLTLPQVSEELNKVPAGGTFNDHPVPVRDRNVGWGVPSTVRSGRSARRGQCDAEFRCNDWCSVPEPPGTDDRGVQGAQVERPDRGQHPSGRPSCGCNVRRHHVSREHRCLSGALGFGQPQSAGDPDPGRVVLPGPGLTGDCGD